jgi:hypothetical protein
MTVSLYTIGPSSQLVSRFGHSLLCVREGGKDAIETGRCFDYGVIPDHQELTYAIWTSIREKPSFIPVVIEERLLVQFFRDQGRQIERQSLPLTSDEAARLVGAVDAEVQGRRGYAYHPYFANCATRLRDHIDAATNGRLHKGPSVIPKGSFREYMEEGHSGHVDALAAMALYLGDSSDRVPTPWEAMLLPSVLRDGVAERFAAPPEKVAESMEPTLPTSRTVGRIAVVAVGVLLFVAVRIAAQRDRLGLGLMIAGGVLGVLALSVELTSALVKWPEVSHNWALLVLLPTDFALASLRARLAAYLRLRLTMVGVLAALEIAGVIHQPVLPLAILVALPMFCALSALRDRAGIVAQPSAASTAPPVAG